MEHSFYFLIKTCPAIRFIFLGFQPLKGWKPKKDAASIGASLPIYYSKTIFGLQTIFPTFENPVTALDSNRFPFAEIILIVNFCLYTFLYETFA